MTQVAEGGLSLGIVGTGFVSRHLAAFLRGRRDVRVAAVLTRRHPFDVSGFQERVTRDLDVLIDGSDMIVECSGDPLHATEVIAAAISRGRPVVTMNSEFHVTAGSAFVEKDIVVTEAEGDQPGSLAAFSEDLGLSGFKPLVYGSLKGYLDNDPTPDAMAFWAQRQGISTPMTTAFTDGTKLQIEQALVCNGLGATIAGRGMIGLAEADLEVVKQKLVPLARAAGQPIADYAISPAHPHGVFIIAEHEPDQEMALRYLKLGDGPEYLLMRNSIFAHLEIIKTIRRVVDGGGRLLDNSPRPRVGVAAVAKRALAPGTRIARPIGGQDVRGETVLIADRPDHVPIGLLDGAVVEQRIERGATVTVDDVELPESLALDCWRKIPTAA